MNMNLLQGKNVYAFGDSIVYGHTAPETSFMQLIADETKITLTMNAKNGATVIDTGENTIVTQVRNASCLKPDIVLFDGYTNDAYSCVLKNIGYPKGRNETSFDNKTFCGAFEEIIYTIKTKWPDAKLLFVAVHKNAARDWSVQLTLHDAAVAICREWGVEIADVFSDTAFDTRDADQMKEFIIGASGSHPNEAGYRKFYIPLVIEKLCALEQM
ncbi:MAG: SGNH/GDSL hydrolase family protein [Clostridia bacterium]|nr:SGNH/GDSL hydrolase family protein [Clostridia bacterium]